MPPAFPVHSSSSAARLAVVLSLLNLAACLTLFCLYEHSLARDREERPGRGAAGVDPSLRDSDERSVRLERDMEQLRAEVTAALRGAASREPSDSREDEHGTEPSPAPG